VIDWVTACRRQIVFQSRVELTCALMRNATGVVAQVSMWMALCKRQVKGLDRLCPFIHRRVLFGRSPRLFCQRYRAR